MSATFDRTTSFIEKEITEGEFTRGAQICVSLRGERVLDLVLGDDGRGQPMLADTLFRVYCTIKPITALAIAKLVDDGLIGLDEALTRQRPSLAAFRVFERGGVSLRDVLNHTAGLHTVQGVRMEMLTPQRRREELASVRRPPGWHVGSDAGYSEYLGWHALGLLIEDITGEPVREHLRRSLLDPLGLTDTFIGMTQAEYIRNVGRIGVNYDLRDYFKAFPMLVERTPTACCAVNCAFGGYTTSRDLATLYTALLERLGGHGPDCLPSAGTLATFCSSARPSTFDVVLGRECEYGLGFMTAIAGHQFGREPSPAAFGHSGNVGSSFAFADPLHELAVAVILNGVTDADTAFLRRPAVVRALYLDLGLEPDPDAGQDMSDEARPRRRLGRFLGRAGRLTTSD